MNRREFLHGVVRLAGLAAAVGIALRLGVSRRRSRTHVPCVSDGICPRCPRLARCPLPQAELVRLGRERQG